MDQDQDKSSTLAMGSTPAPILGRPRISLLHATYKRQGGPFDVRDAWLGRAVAPDSIEYLLSMDADDLTTVGITEGFPRLVNPLGGEEVTAVRNWNAAAAASKGDLLVVIADDLFPPYRWDQKLLEMIGSLNPVRTPFVVKVSDSPKPGDLLLRHPVVSRAYYTRFGLFSPLYRGVYCDNDFTTRAYWRSVILDGRSLQLEHRNPRVTDEVAPSESHRRMNRREEYERGRAQYLACWPPRKRCAIPLLVENASAQDLSHWGLAMVQRKLRARSNLAFVIRRSQKARALLASLVLSRSGSTGES